VGGGEHPVPVDGVRVKSRHIGLCIAAAGAFALGCGGSGSSSRRQDGREEALAAASAINLRAADVPGTAGRGPRPGNREVRFGPFGDWSCAGSVQGIVTFGSPRFGRGGTTLLQTESVASHVTLMASEAQAAQDYAALGSAQARACVKRKLAGVAIRQEREGKEPFAIHVAVLSLEPLPRPLPVHGIRQVKDVAIAPPRGRGRSKVYLDECDFVVGRLLVDILAEGSPNPFPVATERRLLVLLYGRAKAHKL